MKKRKQAPYEYDCGAKSGQRVRLKRDFVIAGLNETHNAGEIWNVLRGSVKRPRYLVRLRRADGRWHLWTGETFWDNFEIVK